MRQHLSFAGLSHPHRGNVLVLAGAMFALGLAAGATVRSPLTLHAAPSDDPARGSAIPAASSPRLDPQFSYPADVIRIIDGDTFEARVRVWPGLDVDTKVRLRGIDAPELHARCGEEHVKAEAARAALEKILAEGSVAVSRVGVDKYGGRVDAAVSTRTTADVSAALLNGGFARSYDGRRRSSWCG
jgi:endonuclease YncB( thermonuclease family)